jgi:hypothetical protein
MPENIFLMQTAWVFIILADMESKKPKEKRSMEGRLEVRLDPKLKTELEQYASDDGLMVSEMVRGILVDYLKKRRKEGD